MHTDLEAGDFGSWLAQMQGALRGEHGSDVPCNGCTACCTSSQFVHIGPDETDTLAHIPPELLFPAPRLPRGHMLLGYDERGHCPMLIDNRCSIYEHRPVTCRTYDCRIFPATALSVDGEDKVLIAQQAQRWRFSFPTQAQHDQHDAVRAAASYLRDHPDVAPSAAGNATQLAVLAVEVHEAFLGSDTHVDEAAVRVEVQRRLRG
ncbi:MAG: YkgJ family cysteine cluster protein [Ilumatobacteraceae bacterium]